MLLISSKIRLELNQIQGVRRLFVLSYFIAAGNNAGNETGIKDNKKYFFPKGKINNLKRIN